MSNIYNRFNHQLTSPAPHHHSPAKQLHSHRVFSHMRRTHWVALAMRLLTMTASWLVFYQRPRSPALTKNTGTSRNCVEKC